MKVFDVWAEWCPPCKAFGPIFERVSKKFPDVEFVKINADEEFEFLKEFQIQSIPTILFVDSGKVVFRQTGILPEKIFEDLVSQVKSQL